MSDKVPTDRASVSTLVGYHVFDGFQDLNLEEREALECLCHVHWYQLDKRQTHRAVAPSVRVSSLPPPNLKSPSQDCPYSSFCLVHLSRMINAIVVVKHCPSCHVYLLSA